MSNNSNNNVEKTVVYHLPTAQSGHLACIAGALAGRSWPLSAGTFTIGRLETCDLCLNGEAGVSKTHAKIIAEGENYVLIDQESRNGTLINGKPVQKALLRDGDEIQICNVLFRVSLHAPGKGMPAPIDLGGYTAPITPSPSHMLLQQGSQQGPQQGSQQGFGQGLNQPTSDMHVGAMGGAMGGASSYNSVGNNNMREVIGRNHANNPTTPQGRADTVNMKVSPLVLQQHQEAMNLAAQQKTSAGLPNIPDLATQSTPAPSALRSKWFVAGFTAVVLVGVGSVGIWKYLSDADISNTPSSVATMDDKDVKPDIAAGNTNNTVDQNTANNTASAPTPAPAPTNAPAAFPAGAPVAAPANGANNTANNTAADTSRSSWFALKLQADAISIKSPGTGKVTSVSANVGANINKSSTVAVVEVAGSGGGDERKIATQRETIVSLEKMVAKNRAGAQAALDEAKAELKRLEQPAQQNMRATATSGGKVSAVNVRTGDKVRAGQVIATVEGDKKWVARIPAAQAKEVEKIEAGAPAEMQLTGGTVVPSAVTGRAMDGQDVLLFFAVAPGQEATQMRLLKK